MTDPLTRARRPRRYVDNFSRFVKRRGAVQAALAVPAPSDRAPVLSVDEGAIPDADAWAAAVRTAAAQPFDGLGVDRAESISKVRR